MRQHRQNQFMTTPMHNMREICKQMLLLEDHLTHPGKRCPDCITKHFLMIEALADEVCSLEPRATESIMPLSQGMQTMHYLWLNGKPPLMLAHQVRMCRKHICQKMFGY
jgi:hypothetical protein